MTWPQRLKTILGRYFYDLICVIYLAHKKATETVAFLLANRSGTLPDHTNNKVYKDQQD
jgi:hypothetical protein